MTPIISIIIPVYNVEKYIAECLDSIICQDCKDCEIILVDDGSTDNSLSICEYYCRKYKNIIFIHKENGGVSSARNVGINMAKGKFISFVDADDWVESNYIQTLKSYIKNEDAADIIFFSMFLISQNGEKNKITLEPTNCKERTAVEDAIFSLRYAGERDTFGWTWDKIFKKDIIQNKHIRFQEEVHFREDELFTLEFCRYITTLQITAEPLYNYRIRKDGLTNANMKADDYLPSCISLEKSLAYYQHEGIKEHIIHSITSYYALHIYKKCKISHLKEELKKYQLLTQHFPQSGKTLPIQHLTLYIQKNFWLGYLYCLIRKL